jgi:hypothetical protein
MALDKSGSQMVWERYAHLAADLPNIKGRSLITDALGRPVETQAFWVPDPGDYEELTEEERAFIDELTRLAGDGIEDRLPLVMLPEDQDDDEDDDPFAAMFGSSGGAPSRMVPLPQDGGDDQDCADDDRDPEKPAAEPVAARDLEPAMRIVVEVDGRSVNAEVVNADDDPNDPGRVVVEYVTEENDFQVVNVDADELWDVFAADVLQAV